MRYLGVVLDFDGTLADDGVVSDATVIALQRLRASGRSLIMATGRELPDLHATFARVDLFDLIVAENGGLTYRPANKTSTPLAAAPPGPFVAALRARGVRLSVGAVIVATWEEYRAEVNAVIAALDLNVDVILNKGALMMLPPGVNKGTGIVQAAAELSLPLRALVGVGDAQNDYSLLRACGVGVAVANAVSSLKQQADVVTAGARGAGVIEIIDRLLADDLRDVSPRMREDIGVVAYETDARS